MSIKKHLIGSVFGRWTILSIERIDKITLCLCRCECGTERIIRQGALKNGTSKSCGCLRYCVTEKNHTQRIKDRTTTEYISWMGMKARCYNINSNNYGNYGGRGIKVCDRWLHSFKNFFDDMGVKPTPKHSLDRFPDKNGDYGPTNCRWATKIQQANNVRSNKVVSYLGENRTLSEWCVRLNLPYNVIRQRVRYGWSIKEAFETPNFKTSRKNSVRRSKYKTKKACYLD